MALFKRGSPGKVAATPRLGLSTRRGGSGRGTEAGPGPGDSASAAEPAGSAAPAGADARRRLEALNPQSRALMKIKSASPPDSPPDSQRDRKGQGQGQGHKPAAAAPPVDPVKDEIWKTGKAADD